MDEDNCIQQNYDLYFENLESQIKSTKVSRNCVLRKNINSPRL